MQINIRQLCFFRVANASGHPEMWWDYVQAFAANCSMAATRYNVDCAAEVCESQPCNSQRQYVPG